MKQFSLLVLILLCSHFVHSQKSSDAGIFIGLSNYMGDFSDGPIVLSESNFAIGGVYRYFLNPQMAIKGSILFGQISGDYDNKDNYIGETKQFESNLLEFSANFEWHPWGTARTNDKGDFLKQISPYGFIGLGIAFADANLNVSGNEKSNFPEANDSSTFFALPIGLGLRYDLSSQFILSGDLGFRPVFSDHLDGVSENGKRDTNDWYIFGGLTLSYALQ